MQPRLRPPSPTLTTAEHRISSRAFWIGSGVLCLAALVLRLLQLQEFLRENPVSARPWIDAWIYWQMAGEMARGTWTDGRPFVFAPLFPYLLGVARMLGAGLLAVYLGQLVLHLGTGLLVGWVTRLRFGRLTGLVAVALFFALVEPAVASTRVLGSTLNLCLATVVWWRWVECERRGRRWRDTVLAGVAIGCFVLSFSGALLLVPAFGAWLLLVERGAGRRLGQAAVGVFSAAVMVMPATLHNLHVSGELIPLTAHGGINLRVGNGPAAKGVVGFVPGLRPQRDHFFDDAARVYEIEHGRPGTWKEIDGHFRDLALRWIRRHPGEALANVGWKLHLFLTATHYDDMTLISAERRLGVNDRSLLSPLRTAWLLGAVLVALAAAVRRPLRFGPEWALLLMPLAVVLVFFFSSRLRMVGVPVAVGLAAWTLVRLPGFGSWKRWGAVAVLLVPAPLAMINLWADIDAPTDPAQFAQSYSRVYVQLGGEASQEERWEEAEEHYRKALDLWGENPIALLNHGVLLARRGETEAALAELTAAAEADPRHLPTRLYRYNVLVEAGRESEAARALDEALRLSPADADILLARAWLSATASDESLRDGEEAERLARLALANGGPPRHELLEVLAAAQAARGEFTSAAATASRALEEARSAGDVLAAAEIRNRRAAYGRGETVAAPPRPIAIGGRR